MNHPLGNRPLSFFGPEDGFADKDWRVERQRIQDQQREWDEIYRSMPLLSRALCNLAGEITEPVGTSEGEPLTAASADLLSVMVSSGIGTGGAIAPLDAALALVAIQGDDAAIVEAFCGLSHQERCNIAGALNSLSMALSMECRFQPILLGEPIKIPVASMEEGVAVQKALFELGCGFHHGSYPLAKTVRDDCPLSGLFVSRKGVITVTYDNEEDVAYFAKHEGRAVSPATVIGAKSLAELLPN